MYLRYNNIFETKGIEYLVVIAFLALLVPFWIALNKKVENTGQSAERVRNSNSRYTENSPGNSLRQGPYLGTS